ncbi:MAG TPA: 4-hydroxy-tetrahydrodipicolinate reductase [Actinomycetales bacterium]|nr:4-hydroxy-tetrahydrodipicolinate reductase [Actinomycetales bacterium]
MSGSTIKVAVLGARGRMGSHVVSAVEAATDMSVVAQIDVDDDLDKQLADSGAQVAVDFTLPSVTEANVTALIAAGIHAVVGTTGWDEEALARIEKQIAGRNVGVLIAPNFSLSAVLAMNFAQQAAQWFESAEVIELHHPDKVDAPSGTAVHTAEMIARVRREADLGEMPDATTQALDGARGALVAGVPVHSVRLRGLVAHEEILFGGPGEQLTIRTDSFDRISFMPGVLAAIRKIGQRPGLTVGLDQLLDIGK